MVFTMIKKRATQNQQLVDIREAFNLWGLLSSKYYSVELVKIWQNDTHDIDLKLLITAVLTQTESAIKSLENKLQRFSIPTPEKGRTYVNIPQSSQAITDEFIAQDLFAFQQEEIENIYRLYRTSLTNDELRAFFKKMVVDSISSTDKIIHYLKIKGWINTPPIYQKIPTNINEKASLADIANLWDHLTYRYDNKKTTGIIKAYTFDGDFKASLNMGMMVMDGQIDILENELNYWAVPLPKRPADTSMTANDTQIPDDKHMFRTLLDGMQGAGILHIQPIKECTFNDRIRKIFIKLIEEELSLIDKYFKFGKVKGWLNPIPLYGIK